jgi:Fur family ferric uptake transcriptional regulator
MWNSKKFVWRRFHNGVLRSQSAEVRPARFMQFDCFSNFLAMANRQVQNLETAERTPEDRFDDYLQSRGMRKTQQRKVVLDAVFETKERFDADQLMERLQTKGQPGHVSRPTVYRTLSEFVDAGLLRKFELEGRSVYEHDMGHPHNDHLFCVECRTLTEFTSTDVTDLADRISREHQFQMRAHRLIIRGVCSECRQQKRRKRRRVDLI